MKLKTMFSSIIAFAFIMLEPVSAFAYQTSYQTDVVPEIEDEALSLTINFCYSKNAIDIPISGAGIGINRISDLEVVNGFAHYTVVDYDDYKDLIKIDQYGDDVTFAGISGTESNKLAARFALKAPEPEQMEYTGLNGLAKFTDLEAGMYLVREVDVTGRAADYSEFDAFLVSVRLAMDFSGENVWKYDVIADPKTKVTENSVPESSIPISSTPESSTESSTPESSIPISSTPESCTESSTPESSIESSTPESSITISSTPESSSENSTPVSSNPESSNPSEPTSTPEESSKPGIPVITGEASMLFVVILIFFVSALVITVTVNKKKRTDDEK